MHCHPKQSLLEISLSEKTLLEGTSTAFPQNRCTTWVVLMLIQTYVGFRQKDQTPWNPQCFNEGFLSMMSFFCNPQCNWEFRLPFGFSDRSFVWPFGAKNTTSVLRDPRQTSVCGGLLGTKPTQRRICLDALQRLSFLLKMHPLSHPSLHQTQGLVSPEQEKSGR